MATQADFLRRWLGSATRSRQRLGRAIRENEYKDKITNSLVATRAVRHDLDDLTEHLKASVRRTPEAMGDALNHAQQIVVDSKSIVAAALELEVMLAAWIHQENQADGRGRRRTARQMGNDANALVARVTAVEDTVEDLLHNVTDLVRELRRGNHSAAAVRRVEVRASIQREHRQSDQEFLDDEVS
ncbi:hypothetical protein [Kibdelosporangium phytohabitans]|uniref:Uncharacterized protein n=1 Tax=Kibdelosporangium phytohabitans TaxID=860235 RepID=A0A0N9I4G2_9PSEU|nr:hypothetical protein [Kibdelosporangium phytohabitans]ALG10537.1 hypothetical protein AOZ06_29845 [Kibdelosporangium phytohabitans]MBE1461635.1 hypothetical protein [Kibdelosporangium phytohabitans]